MSNIAIKVENLSKKYHIGRAQQRHDTLRDQLVDVFSAPFRRNGVRGEDNIIWALNDVSFEVKRGDLLGIIGRNGAGKSTLLKVLSRITEPTRGRAVINGRVGSLLEVGTGFHQELTGRENIYLNGAILGMHRREIDLKFDEIVAFAEIDKFLDTPVKRYSSGMYVRLAFAVAAHLEPEILLIDEVLAVGDAAFQKKCLGKIEGVTKEGRTVLFVSHNMLAVSQLCERVVVLDNGAVDIEDESTAAIEKYLSSFAKESKVSLKYRAGSTGNGPVRFTSISCQSESDEVTNQLISGRSCKFVVEYDSTSLKNEASVKIDEVSIVIYTSHGQQITNLTSYSFNGKPYNEGIPPSGKFICIIPKLPLRAGQYIADIYCSVNNQVSDWVQQAYIFDVTDGDFYGTGKVVQYSKGLVFIEHNWI